MDGQKSINALCMCILTAHTSEESFRKKCVKQLSQKHFFYFTASHLPARCQLKILYIFSSECVYICNMFFYVKEQRQNERRILPLVMIILMLAQCFVNNAALEDLAVRSNNYVLIKQNNFSI